MHAQDQPAWILTPVHTRGYRTADRCLPGVATAKVSWKCSPLPQQGSEFPSRRVGDWREASEPLTQGEAGPQDHACRVRGRRSVREGGRQRGGTLAGSCPPPGIAGPTLPIPPRRPLTLQPLRNAAAIMIPRSAGSDHHPASEPSGQGSRPQKAWLGGQRGAGFRRRAGACGSKSGDLGGVAGGVPFPQRQGLSSRTD